MTYHALVCCRAGMGSSMMLKIKADQVIKENSYPIVTRPGNLKALHAFTGDLVITMNDLVDEVHDAGIYAVGVDDILNVQEIKAGLEAFLASRKDQA